MGMWPGDDYFASRYDYLTEYVQVLRDLWGTGRSDFKGDYFTMNDCRVSPRPSQPMKVILRRAERCRDGLLRPACGLQLLLWQRGQHANGLCPDRRTHDAGGGKTGRDVGSYVLFMVIADETDEAARAKWEHYKAGADEKRWRGSPSRVRKIPDPAAIPTCARWLTPPRRSTLTWAPWSDRMPASPVCLMK